MKCLPILLVLNGLSLFAQDAAPAGMVLLTRGDVSLMRGETSRPARLGELLFAGDRVSVLEGEAVVVFCPLGKRLRFTSGSISVLGEDHIETSSGPPAEVLDKRQCAIPKVALGAESLERIGGMRPRGEPPVTVFLGGRISTGRPHFEWQPIPEADVYGVSVSDELGRVLWSVQASESAVDFPVDRPGLPDGWFSWEVVARNPSGVVARQVTSIEVRRVARTGLEAPPAPEELLLRAVELEDQGYFAEAGACLRLLKDAYPSDARLRRRLAWLYWKAGLLPAFNREMRFLDASPGEH